MEKILVGIIMGSDSDLPVLKGAAEVLEDFGIAYEITVVSAHRTPERMVEYAKESEARGLEVIIAGAGGAAHLPGMVASITSLPVIGVPVNTANLQGMDSLLSIVQMPAGVPVATVAINNAKNAGILAAQILGVKYPEIREKLKNYKEELKVKVEKMAEGVKKGESSQREKYMTLPYYRVNTARYTKVARVIEDPAEWAHFIKRAKRPLFVIGPQTLEHKIGEKLHLEYCLEIAKAANIPICATAHTKKKILELGVAPESSYDTVEIINALKDPKWEGVRQEGNHDLVIFSGIRCDFAERGLATLKHFAPHLKTMALCRFSHPNADYALPIILDSKKWKDFFEGLLVALKEK